MGNSTTFEAWSGRIWICRLNCTIFDQLLPRKIIKIVTTRWHILRLKYTKFDFGWGSPQNPLGELTALELKRRGPSSKARGMGRGNKREGRDGEERGGKVKDMAHSDCCFFCAVYKYSYLLTYMHPEAKIKVGAADLECNYFFSRNTVTSAIRLTTLCAAVRRIIKSLCFLGTVQSYSRHNHVFLPNRYPASYSADRIFHL